MNNTDDLNFNVYGAPQRPIETFTHTAAAEDEFTSDPLLLSDQADWLEINSIGEEEYSSSVEHLYCFFRAALIVAPGGYACNSSGMRWGVEMVGYECDADGRVKSWSQRLELSGPNTKAVRAKMFFLWQNDLLHPVPVEVPFEFEDAQIARQS